MDRFHKAMVLSLIVLSVSLAWQAYAISAPSISSIITPGSMNQLCTFTFYKDGSTYLSRQGQTGDNAYSGTTFSTMFASTLADSLMTNGGKLCFEAGTFTITTALAINIAGITIAGAGRGNTIFSVSGNIDGMDVTKNSFAAYDFTMTTVSAQSAGVAIKLTASFGVPGTPVYYPSISRVDIGCTACGNARQYFFQGMYVQANYGYFSDMRIGDFVNTGIQIDGAQNDEHFSDIQFGNDNFGAASNPLYCFKVNWSQAAYYTNILTAYCKFGFYINPQNTEAVFWQFFTNLQLVDTTGMHFWTGTSGTGTIRQLHFSNLAAASDCESDAGAPGLGCVGASKELPSILLQNVQAATIEGGEVAGNTWEGIIINGTSTDVDIHGLQVRDNNLGNNLGINGLYGTAPTPNTFIDDSVLRLRWIGGSTDNPGIGGVTGHAGGIYFGNIGCPQNCFFEAVGFLTSAGARMANAFGCLGGCQGITFRDNFGFNPFGQITTPFATTGTPKTVGICTGCTANPTTATAYQVAGFDVFLNSTGGTGVTIQILDYNNIVNFQGATANNIFIPIGYQIKITFSGLPTVKIFGN